MNDMDMMLEPLRVFAAQAGVLLPRALVALLVLLAGWVIAKVLRFAVAKALRAVNFNVVTERAGMDGFLRNGGIRADTTDLLALLCYWLVILAALIVGFNGLGLTYITDLLARKDRFNVPGTAANSNWSRRMQKTVVGLETSPTIRKRMRIIRELLEKSGRSSF